MDKYTDNDVDNMFNKLKKMSDDIGMNEIELELKLFGTDFLKNDVERSIMIYEYLNSSNKISLQKYKIEIVSILNELCIEGCKTVNSIEGITELYNRAKYCDRSVLDLIKAKWNQLCIDSITQISSLNDVIRALEKSPAHSKSRVQIINILVMYIRNECNNLNSIRKAATLYKLTLKLNNKFIQKELTDLIDGYVIKESTSIKTIFSAKDAFEKYPQNTPGSKQIIQIWEKIVEELIPTLNEKSDFNSILDNIYKNSRFYSAIFDLKWQFTNIHNAQSAEDFKFLYYESSPYEKKAVIKAWDEFIIRKAKSITSYEEAVQLYKDTPPECESRVILLKIIFDLTKN